MARAGDLTRRELLKGAACSTAALAMDVTGVFAQAPRRPPNIVFIMADDLGYADVSCYGRPDFSTPNVDRLAASGVRFLQAYANSAVCSATRTALMTGRYQYRLRVGLEEPLTGNPVGLPREHPTIPSLLRALGYSTSLVGKWHLGQLPTFGPLLSGYDHFYGFRGGAVDYYSHGSGGRDDLWDDDVPVQEAGYLTNLLGNRGADVIDRLAAAGSRFYVSLHFNAPHWPWEAPGDEAESSRIGANDLHHFDGGTQRTYQRMVEAMDVQVGRVVQVLERRGIRDNTIIVFTSDNGGERFSATWPFTGRKQELLEGGVRIPAIVSWPERLPQGVTSQQVTITMDWLPTLLAAAGGAPDVAFPPDGINLLPLITPTTAPVARTLYWRYKANAQRAVRDGDWKYLKILDNEFLFQVVNDPMERANLKVRRKDIFDRLVAQWHQWNATMLPEVDESNTSANTGDTWADHIGAQKASGKADNPTSLADRPR